MLHSVKQHITKITIVNEAGLSASAENPYQAYAFYSSDKTMSISKEI
jgi:hypothetical protein